MSCNWPSGGGHRPGLSKDPCAATRFLPCVTHPAGMTLSLGLWAAAWSCESLPEVTLSHRRNLAPKPDCTPPGRHLPQLGPSLPPDSLSGSTTLCHAVCGPGLGPTADVPLDFQPFNFHFTCRPEKGGRGCSGLGALPAASPSQGLPGSPAKPRGADLTPWTPHRGDLSSRPRFVLRELGARGQVPGLPELPVPLSVPPPGPVRQPQGPAGGGAALAGVGRPPHRAHPRRVREHAPQQALSAHHHGVVRPRLAPPWDPVVPGAPGEDLSSPPSPPSKSSVPPTQADSHHAPGCPRRRELPGTSQGESRGPEPGTGAGPLTVPFSASMEGGELFSRIQERGDQAFTERGNAAAGARGVGAGGGGAGFGLRGIT